MNVSPNPFDNARVVADGVSYDVNFSADDTVCTDVVCSAYNQ